MSTYDLLANLPVEVDGYALSGLSAEVSPTFTRVCTVITISGDGGVDGVGEDVTYHPEDHEALWAAGPVLDLAGSWTLGELCARIESLDLFPMAPVWEVSRIYRIWGFESAALDLALRQNGLPLFAALRRTPKPMRYVVSLGLGDPPTLDPVKRRLALDPTLRFKLDAKSSWTPELIEALVATGAVDSIDLKSFYRDTQVDQPADPVLYQRVAVAFPDAWLEDPDIIDPATAAVLEPYHDRITWDYPIHSVADIEALAFKPRTVNVKPSRIGTLERLCAAYDYCERNEIGAYSGGQTELGPGRGQAQYLSAVFHPDAPNDLAPSAYNQEFPPAGLPPSPLWPVPDTPGFRWEQDVPTLA
jgi:hypothetical protein